MAWSPTARAEVVKAAWPAAFRVIGAVRTAEPSKNVTVPVAAAVPALTTVAVKVTAWPKPEGLTLEVTVVVVEFWFEVPPMICVSSGELGMSPMTSTLPKSGAPASIGAKIAPMAQVPLTGSEEATTALEDSGAIAVQAGSATANTVLFPVLMEVRRSAALPSFSMA